MIGILVNQVVNNNRISRSLVDSELGSGFEILKESFNEPGDKRRAHFSKSTADSSDIGIIDTQRVFEEEKEKLIQE